MVAAFNKKNTVEQTGFNLVDQGFTYCNRIYKFSDVVETGMLRSVFELKTVLIGSDFSHSISVLLTTKSGERLQVTEQPTMTSSGKISSVEHVEKVFNVISKETWDARVNKYVSQVNELGYFTYSGWRIFPSQRKILRLKTDKYYDLSATSFGKRYGFITVIANNEGVASKLFKKISGEEVGISTLVDTDVFFALLKHYFKLAWKS